MQNDISALFTNMIGPVLVVLAQTKLQHVILRLLVCGGNVFLSTVDVLPVIFLMVRMFALLELKDPTWVEVVRPACALFMTSSTHVHTLVHTHTQEMQK